MRIAFATCSFQGYTKHTYAIHVADITKKKKSYHYNKPDPPDALFHKLIINLRT